MPTPGIPHSTVFSAFEGPGHPKPSIFHRDYQRWCKGSGNVVFHGKGVAFNKSNARQIFSPRVKHIDMPYAIVMVSMGMLDP